MKIGRTLTGIGLVVLFLVSAFAVVSTTAVADSREAPSWAAPNWKVNDAWSYYSHDDPEFDPADDCGEVTLTSDPNTVVGVTCWNTTADDTVLRYKVSLIDKTNNKIKIDSTAKRWVNQSYDFVPNANGTGRNPALQRSTGTCNIVVDETGIMNVKADSLAEISGEYDSSITATCQVTSGNIQYGGYTETASGEWTNTPAANELKYPMVGAGTWNVNYQSVQTWRWTLTPTGGGTPQSNDGTTTTNWNYVVTVGAAIEDCKLGSTLKEGQTVDFQCYKLHNAGDWSQSITSTNGQPASGSGTFWSDNYYSKKVGYWANFNETRKLISYSYTDFTNTVPSFTTWPTADVVAEEDKPFEFKEGVDYVVDDPDPGNAGTIIYKVKTEKSDPSLATLTLTIDSSGTISFTPTQAQVTTGDKYYLVTINVTDGWDPPGSTEKAFHLKISNTPDDPVAATGVAKDFELNEGATYKSDWKVTDVFNDSDKGYDPAHTLTYSATGNGSLWVTFNTDDTVSFQAADGFFPQASLAIRMTLKAEDNTARKAQTTVTATVKHVNHKPIVLAEAIEDFEIDEDWQLSSDAKYKATGYGTIDLKDVFEDIDYGNPSYVTGDRLAYDVKEMDPDGMIILKPTGSKYRLEPTADFNGDVDITFTCEDSKGEKAEHAVKVTVLPINDAPVMKAGSADPTEKKVTIYEAKGNNPSGALTEEEFTIEFTDVDTTDTVKYNWTIKYQDADDEDVELELDEHGASYTFKAAWDGEFSSFGCGDFNSSCENKEYTVSVTANDGKMTTVAYEWTLYVKNTNRPPTVTGVAINNYDTGTGAAGTAATPTDLKEGSTFQFDLTGKVTDPDTSDLLGSTKFKVYYVFEDTTGNAVANITGEGATTQIIAGTDVPVGKYTLKIIVDDGEGGQGQTTMQVEITKKKKSGSGSGSPGFEAFVVVAGIIAAVAVIATRRKN